MQPPLTRSRALPFVLAFLLVALALFLSLCLAPARLEMSSTQRPDQRQLEAARAYLISRFDPEVGLLSESEDKGSNIVGYYPELNGTCFCWNTYWVYSDNLLAYHTLRNHRWEIAAVIKQTYDRYVSRHERPKYFEALFGEDIPDQILDSRPYFIEEIDGKYVFIDKHNRSSLLGGGDVSKYADSCMYKALDHLWAGDRRTALEWFHKGHRKFNGVGVQDESAVDPDVPRYDTYKLALILYTSRILEVEIENYGDIQQCLWDAQQENGGITARVNVTTGKPEGSANTETTALALLVYEHELIHSLTEKARWAERLLLLKLLPIVGIVCALGFALVFYLRKRVRRRIDLSRLFHPRKIELWGRPPEIAALSAINLLFTLLFLAVALAPFTVDMQVGVSPEGAAEDIAGAVLATSFMIGFGWIGSVVYAAMSAGLWWRVNAARYLTILVYGIVFLGACIWILGKGPKNILALVTCSPPIAFTLISTLLGTPLDVSLETPNMQIAIYRGAMAALAAFTIYILTRTSVRQHFLTKRRDVLPNERTPRDRSIDPGPTLWLRTRRNPCLGRGLSEV